MVLTFLGTGDAIPSKNRNHTSLLLNYGAENILFDCGEGTQRQIRKADLNPCKINKICISHWHGDHILGLPGLFQTLALSGYNKGMDIYGPTGSKKFMKEFISIFVPVFRFDAKVNEVSGKFFETDDFYLESQSMTHGTPCNAYNFVIKDKLRIDKKKLEKSKLPTGPLLAKLSQGKDVSFEGKKYKSKDFTYVEKGKKISFVFDTSLNKNIVPFVKGADWLIIESSFDSSMEDLAEEDHHMTVKQDAEIAKKAKVGKMFLIHVSSRYKSKKFILEEAKAIFPNSVMPHDLDSVSLK